ncbi:MAG: glycoside hydrolase family 9 protein [Sedimentisphaerales bacterium]
MKKTLSVSLLCILTILTQTASAKMDAKKMNVAPNPSFENDLAGIKTNVCVFGGWFPIGVVMNDGTSEIKIVEEAARTGTKSLRVTPNTNTLKGTIYYSQYNGGEEVRTSVTRAGVSGVRTIAFRLDQDILSCDATVWIKKTERAKITLNAIWYTRRNRIPFIKVAENAIAEPAESKDGWFRYSLHAMRCHTARQVQIVIDTNDSEPFYVDDVEIYFNRYPHADVLVDQLGYETQSHAKGVILQSSTLLGRPPDTFSLINLENSKKVLTKEWLTVGYCREWDLYHWQGDFSDYQIPGRYVVETTLDGNEYYSPPFEIRESLLVPETAELSYRFFYYQRCGAAVPFFHAACHLDDAKMPDGSYRDLSGGWHDAGDYNKYNGYTPESVYALAFAYDHRKTFFDQFDRDANGQADILDEAIWGAKFLEKCINPESLDMVATISSGYGYWGKPEEETDNLPGTGDERPIRGGMRDASVCIRGFALLGKYVPHYLAMAERLYQKHGGNLPEVLALYRATQKDIYRRVAQKRAEALLQKGKDSTAGFRELAEYAIAFPNDSLVPAIRSIARKRLNELKTICSNPFEITRRRDDDGSLIFFRHYRDVNNWYVGESRELMDTAYEGLLLESLGFVEGRRIAENQVHWILGRNPYGVSMMEGVGSIFVPYYHHRYNTLAGNPRGAVPGVIVNGITRAWPDQDRPWLDMHPEPTADYQSNEPWLPHNNRWLFLIGMW